MIDKFIFDLQLIGDAIMQSTNFVNIHITRNHGYSSDLPDWCMEYYNDHAVAMRLTEIINQPYFNN